MTGTPPPSMPPSMPPAGRSEASQALLATLTGQLFVVLQRRTPLHVRLGASLPRPPPIYTPPHIADLVVTERPAAIDRCLVDAPLMIAEIITETTEAELRQDKLPDYRLLPGVREILLLHDQRLYAELHRKFDGNRWMTDLLLDRSARLKLESVGLDLPLTTLYAQVAWPGPLPKGRR